MDYKYLVEGYADEVLLEVFGIPQKRIYIVKNIGAVARQMKKAIDKDEFIVIVGTIDNDKNKPSYFENFKTEQETHNFILKKHKKEKKRQYLIILKPAIEKFILKAAEQANIKPNDYKIPDNFNEFKNITKSQSIRHNQIFRNFLKKIYNADTYFNELKKKFISIHQKYSLPIFWD